MELLHDMPSEFNFPVVERDIAFKSKDNWKVIPKHKAVIRSMPDGSPYVFGIFSHNFPVLTNRQFFSQIEKNILVSSLQNRSMIRRYEMSYAGGRSQVTWQFVDDTFTDPSNSKVAFELFAWNVLDGSMSYRIGWRMRRLICLNGMIRMSDVDLISKRHTRGFTIDDLTNTIEKFYGQFNASHQWVLRMATIPIPANTKELFEAIPNVSERSVATMEQRFMSYESRTLGPNMYALYNTATYWASHDDFRTKDDTMPFRVHQRSHDIREWLNKPIMRQAMKLT